MKRHIYEAIIQTNTGYKEFLFSSTYRANCRPNFNDATKQIKNILNEDFTIIQTYRYVPTIELTQTIKRFLKLKRIACGMSISDVATSSGISASVLRSYEREDNGSRKINKKIYDNLLSIYDNRGSEFKIILKEGGEK